MSHTTHSSTRVLACVRRYRDAKVAKYQATLESDADAVLVRLNREYESKWSWFGLRKLNPPTREQAIEEAKKYMQFWDVAGLKRAEEIADKWTQLLRGTEFVEVSLEDAWILSY